MAQLGQFSINFWSIFGRIFGQFWSIGAVTWNKSLVVNRLSPAVNKMPINLQTYVFRWNVELDFFDQSFSFKIASFWCHILRHFWCQIFNHQKIFNQLILAWSGNLVFNTIVLYFMRDLKLKNFRLINSLSGFVYWTSGWGLVVWDL